MPKARENRHSQRSDLQDQAPDRRRDDPGSRSLRPLSVRLDRLRRNLRHGSGVPRGSSPGPIDSRIHRPLRSLYPGKGSFFLYIYKAEKENLRPVASEKNAEKARSPRVQYRLIAHVLSHPLRHTNPDSSSPAPGASFRSLKNRFFKKALHQILPTRIFSGLFSDFPPTFFNPIEKTDTIFDQTTVSWGRSKLTALS